MATKNPFVTWLKRKKRRLEQRLRRAFGEHRVICPTPIAHREEVIAFMDTLRPVSPGITMIRLGPQHDGGYLVPDDLSGIDACFSPGVDLVSGFEESCANRGMEVFLADKSVDQPAVANSRFHFQKKFIGAVPSTDFMTLDEWVRRSASPNGELLLQMDIEGFEYQTILSTPFDLLNRFRIIVIELHGLEHLWSRPFLELARAAMQKLTCGHTPVHLHPNNCCGSFTLNGIEIPRLLEVTLLRNDRIVEPSRATAFPHPLDSDNVPGPSLPLPPIWYAPKGTQP